MTFTISSDSAFVAQTSGSTGGARPISVSISQTPVITVSGATATHLAER